MSLATGAFAQSGTIGNFPEVAFPPENPSSPEKILLGKALFFEEQLSSDNTMACATCHLPEAGGADVNAGAPAPGDDGVLGTSDDVFGSPGMIRQDADGSYALDPVFGVGRQATNRNAPTVIGAAFFRSLFWDMRAGPVFEDLDGNVVLSANAALESQAVGPPANSVEMAHEAIEWDAIEEKIAGARPLALATDLPPPLRRFLGDHDGYAPLFEVAFGTPDVTRERIAMAIASYERTLVPDKTPFDEGTMSESEQRGHALVVDSGCASCHSGPLWSDGRFHTAFLPDHFELVKTPTLRNAGLRPRLMHSGQIEGLGAAVEHYIDVGFFPSLTAEQKADVIAFLGNGLTDPRVPAREPPFDRPTLHGELAPLGANHIGAGTPGSEEHVPVIIANAPANLGNSDLKVGVGGALGGAQALLVLSPAAASGTLGGVPILVDPARAELVLVPLSGVGPGEGVGTFRMPLPSSPALVGAERFAQWLIVDPAAATGVATSPAAGWTVF